MATVQEGHKALLEEKRKEIIDIIHQCYDNIHRQAGERRETKDTLASADAYLQQEKKRLDTIKSVQLMEGMGPQIWRYNDNVLEKINYLLTPKETESPKPSKPVEKTEAPKKIIKTVYKNGLFHTKTLQSEADIDAYLKQCKKELMQMMKGYDGIKIQ